MTSWTALDAELDNWRSGSARFWWRDDDAHSTSASLDRLLAVSEQNNIPIHLAAIPRLADPALARRLEGCQTAFVVQHGFDHVNHEPPGTRASELGDHRPLDAQLRHLEMGWQLLGDLQMPNLLPVLAPPWNRIADETIPHLPRLGYRILSTFSSSKERRPASNLHQIPCHIDPILWKSGARFRGTEKLLRGLVDRLEQCRKGVLDQEEPIGLLTHHLQSDEATWEFVDQLTDRLCAHPAVSWISLADVLDQRREDRNG